MFNYSYLQQTKVSRRGYPLRGHRNELAVERQHQQHMMARDFVYGEIESWKDDPERAMDFAVITAGNASAYYSYVLFVANPTVGAGIFLVAGVVGGIWATLQHFK